MQKTIRLSLLLGIITAIAATLLGFAYNITDPIIQEGRLVAEQEAMAELLPDVEDNNFSEKEEIDEGLLANYAIGYAGDDIVGYIFTADAVGYGGNINMLVAIDVDGQVKGTAVLDHAETAGLGAKVSEEDFLHQFIDREGPFEVVKSDASGEEEILAISASTITTDAFVGAVNEAIDYFETSLKGAN